MEPINPEFRHRTRLYELENIKESVIAEWKLAKRAESKERIAIALDKFIQQLVNSYTTP